MNACADLTLEWIYSFKLFQEFWKALVHSAVIMLNMVTV